VEKLRGRGTISAQPKYQQMETIRRSRRKSSKASPFTGVELETLKERELNEKKPKQVPILRLEGGNAPQKFL